MSFSSEVKAELSLIERDECCQRAQLAAMVQLLSSLTIGSGGLQLMIRSENPTIAKTIWKLIKKLYNVDTQLSVIKKAKLKKNGIYVIRVLNETRHILEDLELWTVNGLQNSPTNQLIKNECCAQAYLAGCFMASGSINSPIKTDYHLEISSNTEEHAVYIQRVMKKLNLPSKMIQRRKQYVVYIKQSDLITDFLAHIGATDSLFAYAEIKIQRDYMNSITRLENCATANDVKSIQAAEKQIMAIEKISNAHGLENIDEKLREVAFLRLEFPDASINELAQEYEQRTGTILSKSGMKHRLNKLEELAEKL